MSVSSLAVWLVIAATSVLAFVTRAAFIARPRYVQRLPRVVTRMLESVGPAALAALVMPAVLRPGSAAVAWPDVAGLAIAVAVALRWRNSALTIGAGIATICVLRYGLHLT